MKKPVVLVVMDGVGETPEELGNMVKKATTPTLNELKESTTTSRDVRNLVSYTKLLN